MGISCRLVHPNIVRTYGSVSGPPLCIVMEAPTCSLGDLFTPDRAGRLAGVFTHREALDIAIGGVSGVAVLRAGNIVHGDLRRENVLLDGDMTARVCRPGHRAADGGDGGWHGRGAGSGALLRTRARRARAQRDGAPLRVGTSTAVPFSWWSCSPVSGATRRGGRRCCPA